MNQFSYFNKALLRISLVFMLFAWNMGKLFSQDSLNYLSPEQYLALVRQFHPVAKQANILVQGAEAELLASRGMFDPSVYFNSEQKTFDGKSYYNYTNTSLKIPTWFGIEVMAGLENNRGDFANEELTLGKSSYAGLSVPLAKNLLMDRRRAGLAQAKLMVSLSVANQQLMLNDLINNAIAGYWNWVKEYQVYKVLSNAVDINEKRYNLIRITVEQGDRAGVDSTEALTQLLTFKSLQNEAYMHFLAAGFELSNFLWTEEEQPFVMPSFIVPPANIETINPYSMPYQPLNDLIAVANSSHPKLQGFQYKLDALEIERKLKFQSLLPTVNVKYNALADGYQFWKGWNATSLENNYKFGVDVGIPLFLRQGRGDYKSAKLKIESTTLDQDMTRLAIENKVRQYYNEMVNLLIQLRLQEQALQAYQKVFEVEQMKFEIGESTLFLLNVRENKVLEAKQKVAETRAKFFKSLYGVQWAAGVLR
jgi:outer membrane protein TolC